MNLTVALTGAALVVCIVIFASCLTRVLGLGLMNENETPPSQDNSQAATFTQNQANCLNLDDGWWSPIAGPILVKACGPSANTGENSNLQALSKQTETSTTPPPSTIESNAESTPTTESRTTSIPPTETEPLTPSTDVTETKDKEGNTVLSSTIQDLIITANVITQSIKEGIGIPAVAQQVAQQVAKEEKDYNMGLVSGVKFAFNLGEKVGKATKTFKEFTAEQISAKSSPIINEFISKTTMGKSDAYHLGFSRGLSLGEDFVELTGVSGLPYKQKVK
jgi:hypothetical protein